MSTTQAAIRFEREAEFALRAVSLAGELTLDRPERLTTTAKESARDIVTEVDLRAEKLIRAELAPLGHAIIAEESFDLEKDRFPEEGTVFVVDPVDGTANYASGLSLYAVSVGLVQGGVCVAGAVAVPAHKELFFTHGDRGAYLNGRALKVRGEGTLQSALVAVTFSGKQGEATKRAREFSLFGKVNDASRGCLRLGSAAVNVCYVAAGRIQAAYGYNAKLWDVAGALALAAGSGCRVVIHRKPGSVMLDYVVGVPAVVEALTSLMEKN